MSSAHDQRPVAQSLDHAAIDGELFVLGGVSPASRNRNSVRIRPTPSPPWASAKAA
jgi:hypothetical protein